MCGSKPKPVYSDPVGDAQRATDKSVALANAETAVRRKMARSSTLLASGAQGVMGAANTVLATSYGKETLGQ